MVDNIMVQGRGLASRRDIAMGTHHLPPLASQQGQDNGTTGHYEEMVSQISVVVVVLEGVSALVGGGVFSYSPSGRKKG